MHFNLWSTLDDEWSRSFYADKVNKYEKYLAERGDESCWLDVVYFHTDSSRIMRTTVFAGGAARRAMMPDGVLEIYARADRSGFDRHNIALSRRRLEAVQQALVFFGAPSEKVYGPNCKALGERFDAFSGIRDRQRSPEGRSVWIFQWPSEAAFQERPDGDFGRLTTFGRGFVPVF
jgi:hypothetical protein